MLRPVNQSRREFLSLAGLSCCQLHFSHHHSLRKIDNEDEWSAFKARFIHAEGRVVDTGNGNVSHTEGQGWGMLLAAAHAERDTFDRLHRWTRRVLRRPDDHLHAWRYRPDSSPAVDDLNNATDGDLFIAWALLRAADRWRDASYRDEAHAIASDVLRLLTRKAGDLLVLLPGVQNFQTSEGIIVNPSYYAFPAFQSFAQATSDRRWDTLIQDGQRLLRICRFGRWTLPPDWLALTRSGATPSLPAGWSTRFGYDAVRVPLYLAWAGLSQAPALAAALAFWTDPSWNGRLPAWVDLNSDAIAAEAASEGQVAIARLAAAARGQAGTLGSASMRVADAYDYYSAALLMLSRLAWRDVGLDPALMP